jgi:arylsulfatase A-like enzyme
MVGKWHMGFSQWEQTPTHRGFDSFYGFYSGSADYYTHVTSKKGYDMRYDPEPLCGLGCSRIVNETGNYSTHVFTREAIRVIDEYSSTFTKEEQGDHPLFLYLAFQAVHHPDQVPERYIDPYKEFWPENPLRRTYAGMLTAADEGIGNVTAALQAAGMWDDTLVVFSTDNGGPTATCSVQGSSNYPLRGGKCSVWEGGTKGDGFVSGPAMKKLGFSHGQSRRFSHLFHVVDWMPTLAEMVGVVPRANIPSSAYHRAGARPEMGFPSEEPLDGKSQWQSLRDDVPARNEIFVGYTHNDQTGEWYGPALRFEHWKLVQGKSGGPDQYSKDFPGNPNEPQQGGISNATYMLFDLETDSLELHDLASVYPDVVEELVYKLRVYQNTYIPPQPESTEDCPECPGPVETFMGPTWYVALLTGRIFHRS